MLLIWIDFFELLFEDLIHGLVVVGFLDVFQKVFAVLKLSLLEILFFYQSELLICFVKTSIYLSILRSRMELDRLEDELTSLIDETYFVLGFVDDNNTLLKIVEQLVITTSQNFSPQVLFADPSNEDVTNHQSNTLIKTSPYKS